MGIQKVIKTLLLFGIFFMVFSRCNTKSQVISTNNSCLELIHINAADSILLYWAEIAADSTHLINHAGNSRIMISQEGRYYFSYNNNAIANLNNYFNTELKYYKTLSSIELRELKDSIQQWELSLLPLEVVNTKIRTSSGAIDKYLYTNANKKTSCNRFGMGIPLTERIEKVLKRLQ